jgi:hypothetical protein
MEVWTYRDPIRFESLVTDCVSVLSGCRRVRFPWTRNGAPSAYVIVERDGGRYGGALWEAVATELLVPLARTPPSNGWESVAGRALVAGRLSALVTRWTVERAPWVVVDANGRPFR